MAEGDWVTTRLYWTAVHTGAFNGIPASDCLQDGRIVEHRATIDLMALMQQIGAIPVAA
jgi:predicted ester cyclase